MIKELARKIFYAGYKRDSKCDPRRIFRNYAKLKKFKKDRALFISQKSNDNLFPMGKNWPILNEGVESAGIISGHYFHQDLFVAQRIFRNSPVRHIDIGSRTDGFVAHVATFRKIEILDIRDVKSKIDNISFTRADMMKLQPEMAQSTDSISSLHAIEHFGLGRYGDPVDYLGYLKGLASIHTILKKGGKFYFSVPIGQQHVEFNAQRVFSVAYLVSILSENYVIDYFAYVDDRGDLHTEQPLTDKNISTNFGCVYGCGIFELTKK